MKNENAVFPAITELSGLWDVLNENDTKKLKENARVHSYKKNQAIYVEGETPTHVYCLISGKVKITKSGICGRDQIVRLIREGDNFAFRAPLVEGNYLTSGVAMEASCVYAIPLKLFRHFMKSSSKFTFELIKSLANDLGEIDVRVVSLTQKHIRGRLAETLLVLKDTYGVEDDEMTLKGCMSREDLACFANMTTSNAIRTLSDFVSEGIMEIDGRRLKILDENHLLKVSRLG